MKQSYMRIAQCLIIIIGHFSLAAKGDIFLSDNLNKPLSQLNNQIEVIANQIVKQDEFDTLTLDEKIAIYTQAKNYHKAAILIDELTEQKRALNPWVTSLFTIHLKTYLQAKIEQQNEGMAFKQAFEQAFLSEYQQLENRYKVYVLDSFAGNSNRLEQQINELISEVSESRLTFQQAVKIISKYDSWLRLNSTQPLADELYAGQEKLQINTLSDLSIAMADGTRLEAKVYLPKNISGKIPAILIYNLYAEGWNIDVKAKEAAMKGYAGVLVYSRGKGRSQGQIAPFEHEAQDSYDIIDWISKQKWSNAEVGMFGGSYLGFSQWAATKRLHPALKTIVPSTAVVPGLNDNLTENGVLSTYALPWFHLVGNNNTMDFASYYDPKWRELRNQWFQQGLAYGELDKLDQQPNQLFQRWLQHPVYDEYWQKMVPFKQDFAHINIPVLATTGYYDHAQSGSLYYFNQHYTYNKHAEHYLLIGPYDHLGASSMPRSTVNGYQLDPVAHISIDKVIFQWFDYIFKAAPKPELLKDKVNYQVMGTNRWQHASSLEAMSSNSLSLYLDFEQGSNHKLSLEKPLRQQSYRQTLDLADRQQVNDSITDTVINKQVNDGNGIELVSQPLTEPMIVSGRFSGELSVITNKKDFDFVVMLYELTAEGDYFLLSHFKGRASHQADIQQRSLLSPGQKEKINFSKSHLVSKKLAAGSRVVVVLNGNKNAFDQINYGSGKRVADESVTDAETALTIDWFNDSHITLPIAKLAAEVSKR